jgi:hypothetical protein
MTSSRLTALVVFVGVSLSHFVISVAGQALALRVAFDTQPGGTAQSFDVVIVRAADLLLAPLSLAHRLIPRLCSDYLEIAVTSCAVGVAAVGMGLLARRAWTSREGERREL